MSSIANLAPIGTNAERIAAVQAAYALVPSKFTLPGVDEGMANLGDTVTDLEARNRAAEAEAHLLAAELFVGSISAAAFARRRMDLAATATDDSWA